MFLFRPHRGSLADAMKEVVELESKQDLINKIIDDLNYFQHELIVNRDTVKIKPYVFDKRINWDTHIVTLEGYAVFGFTNKMVEE